MHSGLLKQNRMFRLSEGTGTILKRSTVTFFNSSIAQQIYRDRGSADALRSGRPRTAPENIESGRQAFSRSLIKSIRIAARELELPLTTVRMALCKSFRLYAYKLQLLQRLQPKDKPKRKEFADNILQQISEDEELLAASSTDPVSINFLRH